MSRSSNNTYLWSIYGSYRLLSEFRRFWCSGHQGQLLIGLILWLLEIFYYLGKSLQICPILVILIANNDGMHRGMRAWIADHRIFVCMLLILSWLIGFICKRLGKSLPYFISCLVISYNSSYEPKRVLLYYIPYCKCIF